MNHSNQMIIDVMLFKAADKLHEKDKKLSLPIRNACQSVNQTLIFIWEYDEI